MIADSTSELLEWMRVIGMRQEFIDWVATLPEEAGLNGAWERCHRRDWMHELGVHLDISRAVWDRIYGDSMGVVLEILRGSVAGTAITLQKQRAPSPVELEILQKQADVIRKHTACLTIGRWEGGVP